LSSPSTPTTPSSPPPDDPLDWFARQLRWERRLAELADGYLADGHLADDPPPPTTEPSPRPAPQPSRLAALAGKLRPRRLARHARTAA
jgi:hypothetical protein